MDNFEMFDDFNDEPEPMPQDQELPDDSSETSISTEMMAMANSIVMNITPNHTVYVHSTEIAKMFDMRHDNVIRAIERVQNNDETGESKRLFAPIPYKDGRGREQKGYAVSQGGFNLLSMNKMHSNPSMVMAFNIKFTAMMNYVRKMLYEAQKRIKKLEDQLQQQSQMTPLTRDELIAQALIASHDIIEEQKALITQQQGQIATMQPKADFADAFQGSTNNMLVRQVANSISIALRMDGYKNNVGQNSFFEWLRKNGYLVANRKARDFNMPTKKSLDMEIMTCKYSVIEHKTIPGTWNSGTPEITPKGVIYFTEKIRNIYKEGGDISC